MTGLLSVEEIAAVLGEARMPHVLLPAQIDAIAAVLAQAIADALPAWEAEVEARALERAADRLDTWEFPAGSEVLERMYRLVAEIRARAARGREGSQG